MVSNSEKYQKINNFWFSGESLLRSGFYRQSVYNFWVVLRDSISTYFDKKGIDYSSTAELMMLVLKDEKFTDVNSDLSFLYTIGICAEWYEYMELNKKQVAEYRQKVKSILNQINPSIVKTDLQHYGEIVTEIKRHLEDAEDSRNQHYFLATRYRKYKMSLEIMIAILTSGIIFILTSSAFELQTSRLFAAPLSILLLLFTTLRYILKFEENASNHWVAAQNYQRMRRNLINWKSDFPDESYLKEAEITVKHYRERITEINRDAPPLSNYSYKMTTKNKQQKEQSMTYDTTDQGVKND